MANHHNLSIKKIPLNNLIDLLVNLYNKGVDYVDIEGVQGKDQDKIAISFSKDYMTVEGQQNYDDIVSDGKLDDNDINQLII